MKVYVNNRDFKVFLSITFKTKRFNVYTGIQTTEKFSGMVFPKSDKQGKVKTAMLARQYAKVEEYILSHFDETPEQMKEHVKEIIVGAKKTSKEQFLDYMRNVASTRNRPNTRRSYEGTANRVAGYDRKCSFSSIDKRWLEGFVRHETDRGRCINGIATDIANIKSCFKIAMEEEKVSNYPFGSFKIRKEETKKRCLTLEQMRAFRDARAYRRNTQAYIDFFMLGFYLIGMNVSDLLGLRKEDYKNGRISYYRNKTGRLYDIKVEPEAEVIINKYKSRKKGRLLSFIELTKHESVDQFTLNMNKTLRRQGPRDPDDWRKRSPALIDPKVTSYYNRHTWATFASEIGIPLETIGRALGHSIWDKSITSTYVKYDTKAVDEANRKVIDYLNSDIA